MRIAVTRWGDRVSPLFEAALWLLVLDSNRRTIGGHFEAGMDDLNPHARVRLLRGLQVDLLICGAIGRDTRHLLEATGVRVACDVCGRWEDAVQACLTDPKRLERLQVLRSSASTPTDGDQTHPESKP